MSVKFSNAHIAALRDAGQVKGPNLVIPLSFLETVAPVRVRTSETERTAKFGGVFEATSADANGVRTIPVIALADAGLPLASLCLAPYWSGIGDGSCMAYELGCKSKLVTVRVGDGFTMSVVLTPLTDGDREKHQKSLTKAEAKAAAKKTVAALVEEPTPTDGADEGSAVSP